MKAHDFRLRWLRSGSGRKSYYAECSCGWRSGFALNRDVVAEAAERHEDQADA